MSVDLDPEPMPSNEARTIGAKAEAAAKRKYGLETDNQAGHDLRNPENGFVYSVKSCRTETNQGRPGRFRFWRDNHTAFMNGPPGAYILCVYNGETGRIWKIEKVSKAAVDDMIAGKWYDSGHELKDDPHQYKVRWPELLG